MEIIVTISHEERLDQALYILGEIKKHYPEANVRFEVKI